MTHKKKPYLQLFRGYSPWYDELIRALFAAYERNPFTLEELNATIIDVLQKIEVENASAITETELAEIVELLRRTRTFVAKTLRRFVLSDAALKRIDTKVPEKLPEGYHFPPGSPIAALFELGLSRKALVQLFALNVERWRLAELLDGGKGQVFVQFVQADKGSGLKFHISVEELEAEHDQLFKH